MITRLGIILLLVVLSDEAHAVIDCSKLHCLPPKPVKTEKVVGRVTPLYKPWYPTDENLPVR
jgi:hypothetical protein